MAKSYVQFASRSEATRRKPGDEVTRKVMVLKFGWKPLAFCNGPVRRSVRMVTRSHHALWTSIRSVQAFGNQSQIFRNLALYGGREDKGLVP